LITDNRNHKLTNYLSSANITAPKENYLSHKEVTLNRKGKSDGKEEIIFEVIAFQGTNALRNTVL